MDSVQIRYLKEWLSQLPAGNITYKTINGKRYPYYQWTENGKQRGRRVKEDELQELAEKIDQRKSIQKQLKEAKQSICNTRQETVEQAQFFAAVKHGKALADFAAPVQAWKKRECFSMLRDYVYGDSTDRVFVLYGLRRTGKTTLIRQLIAELPDDMLTRTAFIQVNANIDLAKINLDLRTLEKQGYRYIFIDEVTLIEDFIEGAALFSDIYAASGMKIVLSGTDSLGFLFSTSQELYDRAFMVHTTFVPYREFETVLGIQGIDQYIRYGGTMSLGGIYYNHSGMTFASKESADEYVDSAIARNIQHSLKNYQHGSHLRHLSQLYEANELTSAINRVVEDINHRFTLEVLTKDFQSGDLSLSAKNMLRDKTEPNDILYRIDRAEVTQRLRKFLEIKNKAEQTVVIDDAHRLEIKEYLDLLDLTVDLSIVHMPSLEKEIHTAISQPGLRYAQAEALIKSLMQDPIMGMLSLAERNTITQRILSDIEGRMLEDIVLLETQMALPHCEVFKLVFAVGEFDMVVFNPETASCEIYEIKHSTITTPEQYRHLIDSDKCAAAEFRYGTITGKYVIYRGESCDIDGIHYVNVETYLKNLV